MSSGCSSHALTILGEVVVGAGNSKIKCFLWAFPKCPAIPWLTCLESRVVAELVSKDVKNKSSVRRRQRTHWEQVEPRWWRMSPTSVWPYLTKLCSTLIVMTHWASVTLTHPPLGVHVLYVLWILSGWCERAHRSPTWAARQSPSKAPKSTLSVCQNGDNMSLECQQLRLHDGFSKKFVIFLKFRSKNSIGRRFHWKVRSAKAVIHVKSCAVRLDKNDCDI